MKAGREHQIPLSTIALALLLPIYTARRRDDDFIYPGQKPGRPLSNMAFLMLLRRMKDETITPHGFRSTFRDWEGEATTTPREVAEAALVHAVADKTEAAYARGTLFQKRVQLMQDWGEYCLSRNAWDCP